MDKLEQSAYDFMNLPRNNKERLEGIKQSFILDAIEAGFDGTKIRKDIILKDVEWLIDQAEETEDQTQWANLYFKELQTYKVMYEEKDKENELLKVDNDLLKSKWELQGLMIQKLHKECRLLKDTLKDIAEVGEINSYEHVILVAQETLESLD